MYNSAMSNGYQINEKDIDSVLNYLKIHDPENATPEMALTDLSKLEEIYEEFKKNYPG